MNITHRYIPKFQTGGVPLWYLDRYGNRTALLGWNLNQGYDYSNNNLNLNDHRNAGNLNTVYAKNLAYTNTPAVISQDILSFYDSDGNGMSAEDFVKFYNDNAAKIRSHWALNLTYNARTAGEHNRLFKRMFKNRSSQDPVQGSTYNIGYQDNLDDIEGSSTWLRRMDLYENEFDLNNPDSNRLHEITLKDGTKATVYKKANGDIGLMPIKSNPQQTELQSNNLISTEQNQEDINRLPIGHGNYSKFDWDKIGKGLSNLFNNPELYASARLAGNLINNDRVYNEALKGIRPDLRQTYYTHRQVVGDEATKLAYYRRAALGQTSAAKPFTSDADRLMAYLLEAKRIGDELRALGDLADNLMILKTSDESNQHQWANTQRATEIANANMASINQANALKHNLLALKHSALWSSLDEYLLQRETRMRQQLAERQILDDKIWSLTMQNELQSDPDVQTALTKYNLALKKATINNNTNYEDPDLIKAEEELRVAKNNLYIKYLKKLLEYLLNRNRLVVAKSGLKMTYKKKDDLLYRTAEDIIKHFREMSKMSSNSYNRRRIKIEKLTSHPKKTPKYLQGGLAPFTVYRAAPSGGETTVSNSSTSSKKSGDDGNDLLKELFKSLSVEGLPSDVNYVYSQLNLLRKRMMFGQDLSYDDIAGLYIQQMLRLNNIKYQKAQFDKSLAIVNNKKANSELAIDGYGRLAVLNLETKELEYKSIKDYKENSDKYLPLTNDLLLNIRALSDSFDTTIFLVANNATSMNEIADYLKSHLPSIGDTEQTIEGYTRLDSHQIAKGIEILKDAPVGTYKYSEYSKNLTPELRKQANMALAYLGNILPTNMQVYLLANSELRGGASPKDLLAMLVGSKISENYRFEIDPSTGSGSSKSSGGSGGNAENSAGLAFVLGLGPRLLIDFNTGTSNAVRVLGIKGVLQTKSKENLGQGATLLDATKSLQGGYLEWNKATFGGSRLNSGAYSHIILNDSTIMGVDLPYTTDINGNEVPNFLMLSKMEEADLVISLNNITDINKINEIYQQHGLAPKYNQQGELNTMQYKRFAAIQATLDENSLENKSAILSDEVALAGDVERDLYEQAVKKTTGDKNYSLSDGMWFTGWGGDNLYKGTIFVPYSEDIAFAALSSGEPFKQGLPDNAATILLMLYASKASTYKAPEATLSQVKEN